MKPRIYYTKPSITDLEVRYATDAAASGWGEHCYEYLQRFEAAFKASLNMPYAISTSSCTGALHMGLAALGIGPGDEVILPSFTIISCAAATRPFPNAMKRAASTRPQAWIMRTATSASSVEKRERSASARMMAKERS